MANEYDATKVQGKGPRAAMLVTFPEHITDAQIEYMMRRMLESGKVDYASASRYNPEQTGPTLFFP